MPIYTGAECVQQFVTTLSAVVMGASISHWLEQSPEKPNKWRRPPAPMSPREHARARQIASEIHDQIDPNRQAM
jgi:hypothetical protein